VYEAFPCLSYKPPSTEFLAIKIFNYPRKLKASRCNH